MRTKPITYKDSRPVSIGISAGGHAGNRLAHRAGAAGELQGVAHQPNRHPKHPRKVLGECHFKLDTTDDEAAVPARAIDAERYFLAPRLDPPGIQLSDKTACRAANEEPLPPLRGKDYAVLCQLAL
jgi:hypothetical protein